MELSEHELAAYLAEHPDFFERHAELLATAQLPSPHGNRAVSLQERQIEMVRDKMRALEHRLTELMRNAADNEALSARLLGWARALLVQTDPARLPGCVVDELRERFELPLAALRIWGVRPEYAALEAAAPVGDDIPVLASSLSQPFCGANAGFEAARWLPAQPQSLALVALRREAPAPAFGLLVLGSQQSDRFTADMGTEFLARIGEVASAALLRLLPQD